MNIAAQLPKNHEDRRSILAHIHVLLPFLEGRDLRPIDGTQNERPGT